MSHGVQVANKRIDLAQIFAPAFFRFEFPLLLTRRSSPCFPPGRFRAAPRTLESSRASRAEARPILRRALSQERSPAFCVAFLFSSSRDIYLVSAHGSIKSSSESGGERMIIHHLDNTILQFDQRGTTFHPITAIVIRDSAELPNCCAVDVATQDSVN
jgi:plasmid stability protein